MEYYLVIKGKNELSCYENHAENLMHISKWKKPFWVDYILYVPGIWYSEKCKTMETVK